MDDPKAIDHLLTAPAADLPSLSACPADADSLNSWVAGPPMANLLASTTSLLELVDELVRLRTDAPARFELLETIRPTVYYICTRIERQNTASGTRWTPQLEQAQSLQKKLAAGYQSVVLATLGTSGDEKSSRELVIQALHRAISDLSRVLLRGQRHYLGPDRGVWLTLNQLFHIARAHGLTTQKIRDPENHNPNATTVKDAWLRPALLALAKPNQLRPLELHQLFNALERWSAEVEVRTFEPSDLFCVDLRDDRAPTASTAVRATPHTLGLGTEVLAYELEAFLREIPGSVAIPEYVSAKLLQHAASAWSTSQTRQHQRLAFQEAVEIGIGLRVASACLVRESELSRKPSRADDDEGSAPAPGAASPPALHVTRARDTSPLGFNVKWPDGLPASAQIGEVLSVREASSAQWRIGVLRWIGATRAGTAVTGIELLSPTAFPVSARVVRTKGGSTAFAKALLLPALPAMKRPASLITPRGAFEPMQKIQIQRGRTHSNMHLGSCIGQTENYYQFSFRLLGSYLENERAGPSIGALTQSHGAPRPTNGN